jgi:transcriptional regulator with XRE-family HTH domain
VKRYPKGTWMRVVSAEMLRATMARRSMSMSRLARYAGCSKSMIGHLCSGYKTTCTPELALRIAEGLDVEAELLFVPTASTSRSRSANTREKVPA